MSTRQVNSQPLCLTDVADIWCRGVGHHSHPRGLGVNRPFAHARMSPVRSRPRTADLLSGCRSASIERNCRPLLRVVWQLRTQCQDCRYRTAGPMPAATRWRRAGTLGAASGGLEGSEACPLMLLQQSAQLAVIRSQGSLCVIHTAMIVDRNQPHQYPPLRRPRGHRESKT